MAGIIKVNQYQDFNGNTLFTSDGSGNLTTQEILYPAFDANLSDNQELTNAVATKLNFEEEINKQEKRRAELIKKRGQIQSYATANGFQVRLIPKRNAPELK